MHDEGSDVSGLDPTGGDAGPGEPGGVPLGAVADDALFGDPGDFGLDAGGLGLGGADTAGLGDPEAGPGELGDVLDDLLGW